MEMKTGVPYSSAPPSYSEATMTSPQPTSMIPPPLPPNHQDMPHPPSPSPYQPEPTSNIHNPPCQVPPLVPHQPPIRNPDTSFTEKPTAQQHRSDQNNSAVVHVAADTGNKNRRLKCLGGWLKLSCWYIISIVLTVVIIIFTNGLFRDREQYPEEIAIAA